LIIRFLCEALGRGPASKTIDGVPQDEGNEDIAVVLVSWMRDWEFWRSEARKGGGLDLERLKRDKRLAFVDGLSKMYLPDISGEKMQTSAASQNPIGMSTAPNPALAGPAGRTPQGVLPIRGPPGRVNLRTPTPATTTTSTPSTTPAEVALGTVPGHFFLTTAKITDVQRVVETAVRYVGSNNSQRRSLLILDTPSFLLASNPATTPSILSSTIMELHGLSSHVLVHIPADDALLSLSVPPQPLEIDGHNFLVKTAHMASRILSCRVLDTGYAKDVSGVLRVTENSTGLNLEMQPSNGTDSEEKQGRELLYLVKGDGSVKIFERGAGGEV
jgi:elongator complex protein 6